MTKLVRYRSIISYALLQLLCIMLIQTQAEAGRYNGRSESKTKEVKWNIRDDIIIINYDLKTNSDAMFKVDIVMKKESDSSFGVIPVSVGGHIGEGYFAGTNREIRWDYRRDFPQGLEGEDYFFEIHIQEQEIESQSNWLYYVVGAGAVAVGMAAFLMSKSQEELPSSVTK